MSNEATATLRKEHEAILTMLSAAEQTARQIENGVAVSPDTLAGLLEFLRLFADRCHHGKEEDILFPKLAEKGLPRHAGPVAVMLHEHDQGRGFIRTMVEASEAYAAADKAAALRWAEAALSYAGLLRAHIEKENDILFMMAERLLSDGEQAEIAEAFEKMEVEKMGEGTHERLHALMGRLLGEIFPAARAAGVRA